MTAVSSGFKAGTIQMQVLHFSVQPDIVFRYCLRIIINLLVSINYEV